jgi:hypothetical protein
LMMIPASMAICLAISIVKKPRGGIVIKMVRATRLRQLQILYKTNARPSPD